jgi:alpha-beta hydrolase superfamily lysophospholipase
MFFPMSTTFLVDLPGGVRQELRARIYPSYFLHEPPKQSVCVWLIPGGTYTTGYYDRDVPGAQPEEYSMAGYLANQGIWVIAVDNLGTGQNTVPFSGTELTLDVCADAYQQAVRQFRARLHSGTLLSQLFPLPRRPLLVGVGHSMGGFLLTAVQGRYESFDANIILGWSQEKNLAPDSDALWPEPKDGYLVPTPQLLQAIQPFFYSPNVPTTLIQADQADATAIPTALLPTLMEPGSVAQEAARIRVPVFLAYGTTDITDTPHHEPRFYPSSPDVRLFIQEKAHHCTNFEPTRKQLWQAIGDWCLSLQHKEVAV